jgi:radical SAM protein with 4Fe4S-binding SPASM domain
MLDPVLFKNIVDQIFRKTTYLTFYFQGEPFLHPSFSEMVSYAAEKNMFVSTSTNAHYLSREMSGKVVEAGLHRLIISFDGITPETYKTYRIGGDLEKVKEGINNIVSAKKKSKAVYPLVELQFIIFKHNEDQLQDVKRFAEEACVDRLVFKTAQVYDPSDPSGLIPDNPAYSRYRKNASGNLDIVNEMENSCWRMWSSCVVTWDGGVVPCCFDKDAVNRVGELSELKFREVWRSENYNSFRKTLFSDRSSIEICKNCSEGSKVFAAVDQ